MLKAVIFDMDGVIIDSEKLHLEVDKRVMEMCSYNLPLKYFEKYIGVSNPIMWNEIKKEYYIEKTVQELMELQENLNNQILHSSEISAIEGINNLLIELKENGIKIGIGSSSPKKYIENVINKFAIKSYFDIYISGEEVNKGKPNPDVYLKVAEELKVLPKECVVIEDSYTGLMAAKNAGMLCIGYINPNSGKQDLSKADKHVKSIKEINKKMLLSLM